LTSAKIIEDKNGTGILQHSNNYFYSSPVAFLVFGGLDESSFILSLVLAIF
jgi:hypothetical protein